MRQTKPSTEDLKNRLRAISRDRLERFVLAGGQARGALVNGTILIQNMRQQHHLGILETLVLGHAYLGALLIAASMKGEERVALQVDCSGPIRGLVVEANAGLDVRGYLKAVPIPITKPLEDFNLAPFFGTGLLRITRYLRDRKQPFMGTVDLRYGNLAEDLAHYYLSSEQIQTAFNLSVQFDRHGQVTGAGGLFVQRMPGCREEVVSELERIIQTLPPLGKALADGGARSNLIRDEFAALRPRVKDSRRVDFYCPCNRNRFHRLLAMLPEEALMDLKHKGPFPVELRCHYCNQAHTFTREQLMSIEPLHKG